MSRRTKLLITALFLVLLAIPVVYIAIGWHPANPLRFRLVEVLDHAAMKEVIGDHTPMRVEVKNTSAARIHLYFASVRSLDSLDLQESELGLITPQFQLEEETPATRDEIILQPHSVTMVTALVHHDLIHAAKEGRLSLQYMWLSGMKEKTEFALFRLRSYHPSMVQDYVPGVDTAPLEPTR